MKDKGKASSRRRMTSVKKLCKTVDSDWVNLSKKQMLEVSFSVESRSGLRGCLQMSAKGNKYSGGDQQDRGSHCWPRNPRS